MIFYMWKIFVPDEKHLKKSFLILFNKKLTFKSFYW